MGFLRVVPFVLMVLLLVGNIELFFSDMIFTIFWEPRHELGQISRNYGKDSSWEILEIFGTGQY